MGTIADTVPVSRAEASPDFNMSAFATLVHDALEDIEDGNATGIAYLAAANTFSNGSQTVQATNVTFTLDAGDDATLAIDSGSDSGDQPALDFMNAGVLRFRQYQHATSKDFIYARYDSGGSFATNHIAIDEALGFFTFEYATGQYARFISSNGETLRMNDNGCRLINAPTAPTSAVSNACLLYSKDVSSSSELHVRDESNTETQLSTHNFDHYTPDPLDPMPFSHLSSNGVIGKGVAADLSGALRDLAALTGKDYLHYFDVERQSWDDLQAAQRAAKHAETVADAEKVRQFQIGELMQQEVEITREEALEPVEVVEEVDTGRKETRFFVDADTGEMFGRAEPVIERRNTGRVRHRLRKRARLDEATGKFYRKKTVEEAEAALGEFEEPPMPQAKPAPQWIADRMPKR